MSLCHRLSSSQNSPTSTTASANCQLPAAPELPNRRAPGGTPSHLTSLSLSAHHPLTIQTTETDTGSEWYAAVSSCVIYRTKRSFTGRPQDCHGDCGWLNLTDRSKRYVYMIGRVTCPVGRILMPGSPTQTHLHSTPCHEKSNSPGSPSIDQSTSGT